MVYSYKRKTDRGSWKEEDMRKAIEAMNANKMGWLKASKIFNVPQATLRRRANNKNKIATQTKKHLGRHVPSLGRECEKVLVETILELESRFFGMTTMEVRNLAFQLAEELGVPHQFNKEKKVAGKGWVHCFRLRHPELSLRLPEATSQARAEGFNRVQVEKYFSTLETVIEREESMVFNMDESALTTVQNVSKIFARKGKKQVGAITSAERGVHSTVVVCMSSAGTYIPPCLIFPRKRYNPTLYDGAPVGTLALCNESGYMTGELLLKWIQHFISHAMPSSEKEALLILHGHTSHKYLEAIELAKKNHVLSFCLPSHCTHRLQPLDVSFFGPLRGYYNQAVTNWIKTNPGRSVKIYQVAGLFRKVYERAATPAIAISDFRATGIMPLNKDIFPDHVFLPSSVTNVTLDTTEPADNPLENVNDAENSQSENENSPETLDESLRIEDKSRSLWPPPLALVT